MQDELEKSPLERLRDAPREQLRLRPVTFADHARQMMVERQIAESWIRRVLTTPEFTSVDPRNPSRLLAFGRVPEYGGRWLGVIYVRREDDEHVITAFFDRKAGQRR